MERLTHWNKEKCLYEAFDGDSHQLAIDVLAHYENTNLAWHEITDHEKMFKSYRHICGGRSPEDIKKALELLDAEKQGLLINLTKQFSTEEVKDIFHTLMQSCYGVPIPQETIDFVVDDLMR
jgi:hypothetical protein